jgi:hypothetical protein
MNYPVTLTGFEGQRVEVVPPGLVSGAKLLVNGQPAAAGPKRGQMLLLRDDGSQVIATWKPSALGFDVPKLVVDNQVVTVAVPLKWYQWAWAALPILLVFLGGAIGALCGIVGFSVNARIFRSGMNGVAKFAVTAVVSVVALAAYFVLAVLVTLLVGG